MTFARLTHPAHPRGRRKRAGPAPRPMAPARGSYPDGPGPEVHTQSQLAQLVALGKTLLVIPASSRAWQWPDHVAVPVVDARDITTVLAWPAGHHSPAPAALARAAAGLRSTPTDCTRALNADPLA